MTKRKGLLLTGTGLMLSVCALSVHAMQQNTQAKTAQYELKGPLGLEVPWGLDVLALRIPSDNPITSEKIELGRLLFFDRRLSRDGTVACADCHTPAQTFTDGKPVATGISKQKGKRSAPALINRAFATHQFWDGRAASLEEQAKGPMLDPLEMGNRSLEDIVAGLRKVEGYRKLFNEAFDTEDFTIDHVAKAIATFERTLLSGNSPVDRYLRGEKSALSPAAERGGKLFNGRARCFMCHTGSNFTDEQFHTLGSAYDGSEADFGLYHVTRQERDKRKFKTPTLREIANTAPFMHDGRFKSLEEVVDFYSRGGLAEGCATNANTGPLGNLGVRLPGVLQGIANLGTNPPTELEPLNLSKSEKRDLVQFLKSLSGEGWQHVRPPDKFPE